jgi:hypothetical protein
MMSRTACRSVVPSNRTWRALGYAALHAGIVARPPVIRVPPTTTTAIERKTIPRLACPQKPVKDALQGRAQAAHLNM